MRKGLSICICLASIACAGKQVEPSAMSHVEISKKAISGVQDFGIGMFVLSNSRGKESNWQIHAVCQASTHKPRCTADTILYGVEQTDTNSTVSKNSSTVSENGESIRYNIVKWTQPKRAEVSEHSGMDQAVWWTPTVRTIRDEVLLSVHDELVFFPPTPIPSGVKVELVILASYTKEDSTDDASRQSKTNGQTSTTSYFSFVLWLQVEQAIQLVDDEWTPALYFTDESLSQDCGDEGKVTLSRGGTDLATAERIRPIEKPANYIPRDFVSIPDIAKIHGCSRRRPRLLPSTPSP